MTKYCPLCQRPASNPAANWCGRCGVRLVVKKVGFPRSAWPVALVLALVVLGALASQVFHRGGSSSRDYSPGKETGVEPSGHFDLSEHHTLEALCDGMLDNLPGLNALRQMGNASSVFLSTVIDETGKISSSTGSWPGLPDASRYSSTLALLGMGPTDLLPVPERGVVEPPNLHGREVQLPPALLLSLTEFYVRLMNGIRTDALTRLESSEPRLAPLLGEIKDSQKRLSDDTAAVNARPSGRGDLERDLDSAKQNLFMARFECEGMAHQEAVLRSEGLPATVRDEFLKRTVGARTSACAKEDVARRDVEAATTAIAAFDAGTEADKQAVGEDQVRIDSAKRALAPIELKMLDALDTMLFKFHNDLVQVDSTCRETFPGYKNTVESNYFPSP